MAKDYFIAIKTILKIKSNFPFKPSSICIYDKLSDINESISNCLIWETSEILTKIYTFVNESIETCQEEIQQMKIAYSWVYKISSLIDATNNTEFKATKTLKDYIESIPMQKNEYLENFRAYVVKITTSWLPNMFTFLSFSFLPKTNNDLEHFNGYIKRVYRKITGRKKIQLFLANYGEFVAFLLSMPEKDNLRSVFAVIPYSQFIDTRNKLLPKTIRSNIFAIKRNLQDFVFQLEMKWSSL